MKNTAKKSFIKSIFEFAIQTLMIFAFIMSLRITGILNVNVVQGESMNPTFNTNDKVITSCLTSYKRYDVITAETPEGTNVIKRIIGLPGDKVTIDGRHIYINDQLTDESFIKKDFDKTSDTIQITNFTLEENNYFIAGDNRNNSIDSRTYGPIKKSKIMGKVIMTFAGRNNHSD